MFSALKNTFWLNAKNTLGWKTKRKIVVFAVDDYGNVRLASKQAREALDKAGLKVLSRFDAFDTLEDADDLSALFEVLTSVKDKNGRPAVFTPLALPMNIDFEQVIENRYSGFYNELLPVTFQKLPGYQGVFDLWREGMDKGIFVPEFHGREHLNLNVFRHLLQKRDPEIMANLSESSYTSISSVPFPNIGFTAAFQFEDFAENEHLKTVIREGVQAFEQVFGRRAVLFNAPCGQEHRILHGVLAEEGVRYIEKTIFYKEHQGGGRYKTIINHTGKKTQSDQTILVRNCVFEPTDDRGIDWVAFAMKQIEAAFRWNQPANISTHRVNFCGRIDQNNRRKGLTTLGALLKKITQKWPDVEFMTSAELGNLVSNNY